jgi:hypothetical protein
MNIVTTTYLNNIVVVNKIIQAMTNKLNQI